MPNPTPRYLSPFHPKRVPHFFTDVMIIGGGLAGLRAALEVDAEFPEAWFNLGNLCRDAGRSAAAIEAYEEVIAIGADTGLAAAALGQLKGLKP